MKSRLVFGLLSRHSLTEPLARQQITTLASFDDGIQASIEQFFGI
jgi:hypothetical protein